MLGIYYPRCHENMIVEHDILWVIVEIHNEPGKTETIYKDSNYNYIMNQDYVKYNEMLKDRKVDFLHIYPDRIEVFIKPKG